MSCPILGLGHFDKSGNSPVTPPELRHRLRSGYLVIRFLSIIASVFSIQSNSFTCQHPSCSNATGYHADQFECVVHGGGHGCIAPSLSRTASRSSTL